MARKTGADRYAESLRYFWFKRRAEAGVVYAVAFQARLAAQKPDRHLLDFYNSPERCGGDRQDDVRETSCRGCRDSRS